MKKPYLLPLLCFCLIAFLSLPGLKAQRYVDVEPGVGTLSTAVNGDTTDTGERVDSMNTIYRVQRGGFYLVEGEITNRGWPLRIEAAGEGTRAVIQPAVPSGGESTNPFRPRGDIYLSGLYITNEDELGGLNLRTIRCSADSIRIVIDDCHLDKSGQSAFRLDNPGMRIFITNSVISNVGQTVDPNNGRAIDDRGNDIDTLWIENTTFYNLTSNILRDGGESVINYMAFNQNTALDIGQRGLEMGGVSELILTNNVFQNVGFLGTTPGDEAGDFSRRIINLDSIGDGSGQSITIANNNFYLDTANIASQFPDTVSAVPIFSAAAQAFVDAAGSSDISEGLEFVARPSLETLASIVNTWYTDADPGNNTPPFDTGEGGVANQLPFDFMYQESAASATGSLDGQPLGDLNWWDITPPSNEPRIVMVPPGVGTLNNAIDGDTTATGERIAPENTIYQVERGGFYLLEGEITNRGWPLRIEATGEGERAILQPAVPSGGESTRPFRPRGDIYLSGLYITNEDELGGLNLRTIRCSADSIRIVIDDCHLDKSGQSAFRLDNPGMRIFITNSVISNVGQTVDPNNGRAIDDRGNDIDTLWIENTTFYNLTSNILRDGGESVINYLAYNQNTALDIGQRGLEMGGVSELVLTNNVFQNVGFLGTTPGDEAGDFSRRIINLDSIGDGSGQSITIANNNFYLDTANIASQFPDTVSAVPIFSAAAQAFVDAAGSSDISEGLEFITRPSLETLASIVNTWYTDVDPGNNTPPFDTGDGGVANQLPFDFMYQQSAASATGSLDGQPLGDLNWWDGVSTNLEDKLAFKESLSLMNYPNPFSGKTTIAFQLDKSAQLQIRIANTLGQQVTLLRNQTFPAGIQKVTWDSGMLPAGIYFLQVQAGKEVATHRMILK